MKLNSLAILIALLIPIFSFAGEKYVPTSGFGAQITASATPTELVIEDMVQAEEITNGTFASTASWVTNTLYVIDGGVATFTGEDATGTLSQVISTLTADTYRLVYTVTIDGIITNTITLGDASATLKTASGTYTEDLTVTTGTSLSFTSVSTDVATNVIDNVSVRRAPKASVVKELEISVGATSLPVYFSYNSDVTDFNNRYTLSRTMMVSSNSSPIKVKSDRGIANIWYRSASGTPTFEVIGY